MSLDKYDIEFSVHMDAHYIVKLNDDADEVLNCEIEDPNEVVDGVWYGVFKGVYIDGTYYSFNEERVDCDRAVELTKDIIRDIIEA